MRIVRRLEGNGGQGVIEVLAVAGLFGALVAVGAPWYLGFQSRRGDGDAQAQLVAAMPAAQVYFMKHRSYVGMDSLDLVRIDPRVSPTLAVASARRRGYCLTDTVGGKTWSLRGPATRNLRFRANARCA